MIKFTWELRNLSHFIHCLSLIGLQLTFCDLLILLRGERRIDPKREANGNNQIWGLSLTLISEPVTESPLFHPLSGVLRFTLFRRCCKRNTSQCSSVCLWPRTAALCLICVLAGSIAESVNLLLAEDFNKIATSQKTLCSKCCLFVQWQICDFTQLTTWAMIFLLFTAASAVGIALAVFWTMRSTKDFPRNLSQWRIELVYQWMGFVGVVDDIHNRNRNRIGE